MKYEFDAKKYEKASAHQKEWGNQIIGQLELSGFERVLDLGCGDGALTVQLTHRVRAGHVVGVDSSESMIALARKNESTNLTFRLLDINDLDYANEFDVVFSNATLQWIKDHPRLLDSTFRALRAGGVARFSFAGADNCAALIAALHEVMDHPAFCRYFASFEWPWFMPAVDEYRALCARCPFSETRVWEENADRYFPDALTITRWIDQPCLVPFLPSVDPPDRQAFRDAVVERTLDKTRRDDGRHFETFRRINVFARK